MRINIEQQPLNQLFPFPSPILLVEFSFFMTYNFKLFCLFYQLFFVCSIKCLHKNTHQEIIFYG